MPIIDQQQTRSNRLGSGYSFYQSYTAGTDGWLAGISLDLQASSPSAPAISTRRFRVAVVDEYGLRTEAIRSIQDGYFDLYNLNLQQIAGRRYTFTVSALEPYNSTTAIAVFLYQFADGSGDDPYIAGASSRAMGTGGTFYSSDLRFATYINTQAPTSITLAVSTASVTEDGTTNLLYTFSRTGPTTSALTVNYSVGGTATFGSDYAQRGAASYSTTSGTVTFAAGAANATVTVDPTADTTVESDETVALTLATGTGYTVGTTAAVVGTITNDDVALPSISLAVSTASVTEDGTTNLLYTFSRTGPTTSALTVNYSVGGTATLGTDYTGIAATPATKTVTFAAGAATATVTVDPTADTTVESDETVALTLATGTGYTVGTTAAVVGTITNDDLPSITLALSPTSVAEDGTTNLIYTFSRTGPTTSALTVNYKVGGTATLGTDYTQRGAASFAATSGTVTFAAGAATATVTVDPTADTTIESNETVAVTLATGTGYTVGTTAAVVGAITNDDVESSSTTTLSIQQSSLRLTGTNAANATGNDLDNILIGNSGRNILDGRGGVDVLTGGGGSDVFRLSSRQYAPQVDVITDFNSQESDRIEINHGAFGGNRNNLPIYSQPRVSTFGSSTSDLWSALQGTSHFVYDRDTGNLYLNGNLAVSGWGDGGLIANLSNKPAFIPPGAISIYI